MTFHAPVARALRTLLVVLALCATAVLPAGCGVRLETPAPTEPVPDAEEVVRETAVVDALLVEELATAAAATADPATAELLVTVAGFAGRHVDELGGTYDSGLPGPSPSAVPGGAEEPAEPDAQAPTPADVTAALDDAARRTGASADATADAGLARLLASIAASQRVSLEALVQAGHGPADATAPTAAPVPQDTPAGVGAADLAAVTVAEDAAGYAYEVAAARSADDERAAAVARAELHRDRADAWAQAAGTAGTAQDPRRTAYALPDDASATATAALGQRLESDLAQSYATLVGTAAPSSREVAVALLADSWAAAVAWGAPPVAFPGLPEQEG